MFDKEIKYVADNNIGKFKHFGSFIPFETFTESGVHPAIIKYISAELDYLIIEDRKRLLEHSVFDYSSPEVVKYFGMISQELKKNKKISFEDVRKLVLQAVSFNLNFLVRPRWALSKLVFNEAESKGIEEIKLTFNYIYYYDYLKTIFFAYISKQKQASLTVSEFENILLKIDKELFTSQPEKMIDNALQAMAEFFNEGKSSDSDIPAEAIEMFLKEKKLIDYHLKLTHVVSTEGRQYFTPSEAEKIIYAESSSDSAPAKTAAESHPVQEELPFGEENKNDRAESKVISPESPAPVLKDKTEKPETLRREEKEPEINAAADVSSLREEIEKLEKELSEEGLQIDPSLDEDLLSIVGEEKNEENFELREPEDEFEEIETEEHKEKETDVNFEFEEERGDKLNEFNKENEVDFVKEPEPESKEEFDIAGGSIETDLRGSSEEEEALNSGKPAHHKEAKKETASEAGKKIRAKDIFDFLSNKDIDKIVSNVFNDDREDFANTMEKITECSSYDEATEILKGVFLTYRINPYTRDAVTLTNSVSNYFGQD